MKPGLTHSLKGTPRGCGRWGFEQGFALLVTTSPLEVYKNICSGSIISFSVLDFGKDCSLEEDLEFRIQTLRISVSESNFGLMNGKI